MPASSPSLKTRPENSNVEMNHLVACPLCKSTSLELIRTEASGLPTENPYFRPFLDSPIRLQSCRSCSFAFVDSIPKDPDFFKILYSHECDWETEVAFHGKGPIFEHARKTILKYRSDGLLLDIGAWVGGFLEATRGEFRGIGIEIDSHAASIAGKRGFDVRAQPFLEASLPSSHFDVVTIIDVLEHMVDPAQNIIKIKDVLKEGGLLYIKVPNYLAQMRKQDCLSSLGLSRQGIMGAYVHINHFTRTALSRYLTRNGFEVIESGFTPVEMWNPALRGTPKQKLTRWCSNIGRSWGTRITNQASHLLKLELGFNLFVLARKHS